MNRIISSLRAFFLILLIISCTRGGSRHSNPQAGGGGQGVVPETDTAIERQDEVQPSLEEDFGRFIERFSKDEQFQLQRIKFPISVIVPDTGDQGMAPKEESIGKYDWEQLDLTYDSTYLTRPYDQYYQVVRYRKDTAVVEIRGINNGIYADYYFSKIDDEWYLVTLFEASF